MRIHHLNGCTLRPYGGRLLHGNGRWVAGARIVCHCLLVEADGALLLVDTALGTEDVRTPRARLGAGFVALAQARFDPEEPLARQLARLGHSPAAVTHVAVTHLDVDHAGGLADFPQAEVHVTAAEWEAAQARDGFLARRRYRPVQWSHGPRWVLHRPGGERWFGLETAGRIEGFPAEVVVVPLRGHSLGHAGIAVRTPEGWLLHAGDAYFYHRELDPDRPRCPRVQDWFQRAVQADAPARAASRERLRTLVREQGAEVTVFCSHDVTDFERLAKRNGS